MAGNESQKKEMVSYIEPAKNPRDDASLQDGNFGVKERRRKYNIFLLGGILFSPSSLSLSFFCFKKTVSLIKLHISHP